MMPPVIFWFDYPPKVEVGAFNAFNKLWDGEVYYAVSNPHRSERVLANWGDEYGDVKILKLYEEADRIKAIKSLLHSHPDAIHILNGFDTKICKEIKPFLFKEELKALLFTERPAIFGNWGETLLRKVYTTVKYSRLCQEYAKYVRAILPLGEQGVSVFRKLGFPKDRIYDFMYCPSLTDLSQEKDIVVHSPLRFVYVGRFFYKTKGTDVLLDALPYLKGEWSLDLVGGYGANRDEVLERIKGYENVRFAGTWDSNSVVSNLQSYDVVLIPSKADGWNLLVNEAFHAGVGVIVSDQAVSHEVVANHGGGAVFKSEDPRQMAGVIQQVIDRPEIALGWMRRAQENVPLISLDTVGKYLYDIVRYEFFQVKEKPKCPWL